jgi:hypothetical protein
MNLKLLLCLFERGRGERETDRERAGERETDRERGRETIRNTKGSERRSRARNSSGFLLFLPCLSLESKSYRNYPGYSFMSRPSSFLPYSSSLSFSPFLPCKSTCVTPDDSFSLSFWLLLWSVVVMHSRFLRVHVVCHSFS